MVGPPGSHREAACARRTFPGVATAPSAGGLQKPSCGYLDTARAVTAGLVLLGFPVKATLTSSSLHRARFFSHL